MSVMLRAGLASETGAFRDVNQDAAFAAVWESESPTVSAVVRPEISLLLPWCIASWRAARASPTRGSRRRCGANWDLGAHVRRDPSLAGMATTLTTLWLSRSTASSRTPATRAHTCSRAGRLTRQTCATTLMFRFS